MLADAWRLFWREDLLFLGGFAVLFALLLARGKAGTGRQVIRNTLLLFLLGLAAEATGALLVVAEITKAGEVLRNAGVLVTGIAVIRLGGFALFRAVLPFTGIAPPRIVEDLFVVFAYLGWGMLQLRAAGMDLSSLVTTSAVITAVIAFSMQDTLGNVLGGLLLELDDSISIGDWVKLEDVSGRVVEIHWRHTSIRTRNGETVVVPNGALMKTRFTVIGDPDRAPVRWRRWIWFDIAYDVPPSRVLGVVEGALAAADIANVARDPAPNCVMMEFSHGYARYALRYWLTDPMPDDPTDTAVRIHIFAALRRAGIQVALPQYLLHTVKENEARETARHAREIDRRLAALKGIELFAHLEEAELRAMADRLVYAPFVRGDVMTRQGAIAHWLYIVVAGEADVTVEAPGGVRRPIATLGAGKVFGEMGLMTGEPRTATVTAKTDVECYRLDKEGFEDIIRSRPQIAEEMSAVLAARAMGLKSAAELAETTATGRKQGERLLGRIRSFFGLDAGAG